MQQRPPIRTALCLTILISWVSTALAGDTGDDVRHWREVIADNDLFSGDDDGYTGGIAYSWGHTGFSDFGSGNLPDWIHAVTGDWYISTIPGRRRAIAYTIGQKVFTPDDTESRALVVDDRPYVGMLTWAVDLHAFDDAVADRLALEAGVVGSISGAEQVQDLVHDLSGSDKDNGWDNQIENEIVVRLEAERMWRLAASRLGGLETDTVGMVQAGLGNLRSDLGAGVTLRIGRGLAGTWAVASPRPTKTARPLTRRRAHRWQAFLSAYARYVANDVTIDGNTFEDSHSVDLEHAQAIASLGFAYTWADWGILAAYQWGTDEFEGQDSDTELGTLTVSYGF